jgi:alcohol dehydrogenase (cytochrome c)
MTESCMLYVWKPGEAWDIQYTVVPRPDTDGKFSRVAAINLDSNQTVWQQRRRALQASAVAATAGGVIFEGTRDRWFRASNAATGDVLWQARLDLTPNSFPIVYGTGGTEYVAVTTGGGGPVDVSSQSLTPEDVNPSGATTLWVFKLGHGACANLPQNAG